MDKKTQYLIYMTGLMCALSNGFCKPVIKTYFFSLVSPDVIALSSMIETGLAALMMTSISSKGMLSFYRSHYGSIIMISVSCLAVINYMALMDPAIRFVGMAVLDGFTDILWMLILKDAVQLHKNGEELAVLLAKRKHLAWLVLLLVHRPWCLSLLRLSRRCCSSRLSCTLWPEQQTSVTIIISGRSQLKLRKQRTDLLREKKGGS